MKQSREEDEAKRREENNNNWIDRMPCFVYLFTWAVHSLLFIIIFFFSSSYFVSSSPWVHAARTESKRVTGGRRRRVRLKLCNNKWCKKTQNARWCGAECACGRTAQRTGICALLTALMLGLMLARVCEWVLYTAHRSTHLCFASNSHTRGLEAERAGERGRALAKSKKTQTHNTKQKPRNVIHFIVR